MDSRSAQALPWRRGGDSPHSMLCMLQSGLWALRGSGPVGRGCPELQGEQQGPTWAHRRAMAATYICCLCVGKYLRVDEKVFFLCKPRLF